MNKYLDISKEVKEALIGVDGKLVADCVKSILK